MTNIADVHLSVASINGVPGKRRVDYAYLQALRSRTLS